MKHFVTPPTGIKVKYRGKLDLGKFYYHIKIILEDEGYVEDAKALEKEYVEKITSTGKEINIKWEAGKEENKYISYKVDISFRLLLLEDSTDLDMKFIGWVESGGKDYDKLGWLAKVYFFFIQKPKINYYKTTLYMKVYKFLGVMAYE